jgi:flagellar FliJ protein
MYQFNLEILRKYRKRQEEKIQKDLSDLKRKLRHEKELLKNLKYTRDEICSQKNKIQNGNFKAPENLLFYPYINQLDEQIKNQSLLAEKTNKKYRSKYDELIQAVKKRKIMETLKERGRKTYMSELNKREQKNLDEMGIIGFQRENAKHA